MKIFITGNSRSGTTMMSRILGNHKEVFSFQELHFFDEQLPREGFNNTPRKEEAVKLFATLCAIQRHGYFGSRDYTLFRDEALFTLNTGVPVKYSEVFEKFLVTETARNHKSIPCEQTPQTVYFIDQVLNSYEYAKVIVMVRDPRAVMLSQKYKWKRRKLSGGQIPLRESIRAYINYHPIAISKIWNRVMQTASEYKKHPSVLFVKYEDLIQNPKMIIEKVCKHCGINFEESLLNVPVVGSSSNPDNITKQGIDNSRLQEWENGGLNNTEIQICQQINGSLMDYWGYNPKSVKSNMFLSTWYDVSLPFRLGLALLFNLKRLKNIGKFVKQK